MKKMFKNYAAAWAVALVIFNVICFVTPEEWNGYTKFGGAFWGGYGFVTAAMVFNLICAYTAFKETDKQKFFYNVPLITISYSTMLISVVAGAACMLVPDLPNWVAIVVCTVTIGVNVISVIKARTAAELISETDTKVFSETLFIKSLTTDVANLISQAKDEEIKALTKKVYEAVRYSDPVSNEALTAIESQITVVFTQFAMAVKENDIEKAKELCDNLIMLVEDRNKRCKLNK